MFARVSTFQVAPQQDVAALIGPPPSEVQQMDGFNGAYTMMNRETGKAMLITLWDTEEAVQASADRAKEIRAQLVQDTGGTGPAQYETFEILSHP
jgi:heme-degrading monooxygenase HmoA